MGSFRTSWISSKGGVVCCTNSCRWDFSILEKFYSFRIPKKSPFNTCSSWIFYHIQEAPAILAYFRSAPLLNDWLIETFLLLGHYFKRGFQHQPVHLFSKYVLFFHFFVRNVLRVYHPSMILLIECQCFSLTSSLVFSWLYYQLLVTLEQRVVPF